MLKQSDEEYNLLMGPSGRHQGEGSDCRREVTEVSPDPRHEAGDVQVVQPEILDVGQRGELR